VLNIIKLSNNELIRFSEDNTKSSKFWRKSERQRCKWNEITFILSLRLWNTFEHSQLYKWHRNVNTRSSGILSVMVTWIFVFFNHLHLPTETPRYQKIYSDSTSFFHNNKSCTWQSIPSPVYNLICPHLVCCSGESCWKLTFNYFVAKETHKIYLSPLFT